MLADHGDRIARLEGFLLQERHDLNRRVDYLLGELGRRDALEAPRRRWRW